LLFLGGILGKKEEKNKEMTNINVANEKRKKNDGLPIEKSGEKNGKMENNMKSKKKEGKKEKESEKKENITGLENEEKGKIKDGRERSGGERIKVEKKDDAEIEVDVLNYFLTPKVVVLTEKEKEEVLKKFNIKEENLPKIRKDDPLAKALKLEKGQVIKITRDDGTGTYEFYRICV
jgi:DNA-directed RNA polymerase subunit H (RpoH/RPB5)